MKNKPYLLEFLQNFKITNRMGVNRMAVTARRTDGVTGVLIAFFYLYQLPVDQNIIDVRVL